MRHRLEEFIKAAVFTVTSENKSKSIYIAANKSDKITNEILQKAEFIEKLNKKTTQSIPFNSLSTSILDHILKQLN